MKFHGYDPRRGIVPRLTPEKLSGLLRAIPQPEETWNVSGARFELYRIKRLFVPAWTDYMLGALLIDARGSYYVYGDRPPLDCYDEKSAIYMARAIYDACAETGETMPMEEWLSVRLVPPEGEPYGAGELDRFLCVGVPVSYWAMMRLGGGNPDMLNAIPASSRMCGLGPFVIDKTGARFTTNAKHRFSAYCYALIRDLMLRDIADAGRDYRFLSGIIHDALAQKSLTVTIGEERHGIGYTPAYTALGFSESRDVYLDRSQRDMLAYRFPTYWFNTHELLALIENLRKAQLLSDAALTQYLALAPPVPNTLSVKDLRFFGRMLTARGSIAHAQLTGKELRALLDRRVSDGPELKITPLARVHEDIAWVRTLRAKP